MKIIARIVMVLVMVLIAWWLGQMIASETGEVVVLITQSETGEPKNTRLWVVDYEGNVWLRAGSEQAGWYKRIVSLPEITLQRRGIRQSFVAKPEPAYRDTINTQMRKKYGWRDAYIGFFFARDESIPIRLVTE